MSEYPGAVPAAASAGGAVHIFSAGLWRLRDEVAQMSGLVPRRARLTAGTDGAVAGWGHKPTARHARAEARRRNLPYLACEDGFLRSIRPGPAQKPSSMVLDRSGIYYDARQPSDLETMLERGGFSAEECRAARELCATIAACRLSKYNHGRDRLEGPALAGGRPLVLVIDQTAGDESIAGGLADGESFARMFEAAMAENPGATIAVKLHPEVIAGTKAGYLGDLARREGAVLLAENVSPWALLELSPVVYTVSSQFGFEALMAGCKVVCFGAAFYSGWGLTDDRLSLPRRTRRITRDELAAAVYLRYSCYFDAWRRHRVDAATAVGQLDFLRRRFLTNDLPTVCYKIARWKRRAVSAMLDGPSGPPVFTASKAAALAVASRRGAAIAAWGTAALAFRECQTGPRTTCLAVEDGFIRSAGLGAAFVQPLSLVFDSRGLYYDPRSASDLEHRLAAGGFDAATLARAARLRHRLVAEKVTKYNLADAAGLAGLPPGRDIVLVPGQVADDWAVRLNRAPGEAGKGNVNADLLAAVRRRNPAAFVIFKPHPDVEHLGRRGALTVDQESRLADRIARTASLEPLFKLVNRVETFCSLAGFEALLRGLPVAVHGLPFYAGWGLTADIATCERRSRRRSLDELVAAALIDYPRYWDPVSGLVCPPEVVLDRLLEYRGRAATPYQRAARLAGRAIIAWRWFLGRCVAHSE